MTFDFNGKMRMLTFPGLEEKEDPKSVPPTLAQLLSFAIARSNDSRNPVKMWEWAIKLHEAKPLELDKADFDLLKSFVTDSQMLTIQAKGEMLAVLTMPKEEK
jgi:hypothetical protein